MACWFVAGGKRGLDNAVSLWAVSRLQEQSKASMDWRACSCCFRSASTSGQSCTELFGREILALFAGLVPAHAEFA